MPVDMQLIRFPINRLGPPPAAPNGLGTIGGSRPQNIPTALVGAYYRPAAGQTLYDTGVIVVHDFDESFDSKLLEDFATALSGEGYPTLCVALRRQDEDYAHTRFAPVNERDAAEIRAAWFCMRQYFGWQRFYLAGHGFGSVEAVWYTTAVAPTELIGMWHLGNAYPALPDATRYLHIPAADVAATLDQAHDLLSRGLERAYISGPEWAVEAGSFVDYFDPAPPTPATAASTYLPLIAANSRLVGGPASTWPAQALAIIAAGPASGTVPNTFEQNIGTSNLDGWTPCAGSMNRWDATDSAIKCQFVRNIGARSLTGVLYEIADPSKNNKPNDKVVLLTHGISGHFHDDLLLWLGRCLAWDGYTVLSINRSDFGDNWPGATFGQGTADTNEALQWLSVHGYGTKGIFLHGHSFGSYLATCCAVSSTVPLAGLILTGAICNYRSWERGHIAFADLAAAIANARALVASGQGSQRMAIEYCTPEFGTCRSDLSAMITPTADNVRSNLDQSHGTPAWFLEVPVIIVRSAADMIAPHEEAQAIFDHAVTAPSALLIELDALIFDGGSASPAKPIDGHSLFSDESDVSDALSEWMSNTTWVPQNSRFTPHTAYIQARG